MRRAKLIVAAFLALGALATAAPAQAVTVGLADQRAASFQDPRLTELPVRHARLSVAWDAMLYRWQREEIDEWMRATQDAGIRTLVTFGRSRTRPFSLPKPATYRRYVARFMRRYPAVREYSPWNEPNLAVQPRNSDPRRIAAYYRTLRRLCRSCTLLGADVVDNSSLATWMRAYLRVFRGTRPPQLWGLHNYVDVNSSSSWGTNTMLRLAPGKLWFTETGAIVGRKKPSAGPPDRRKLIRTGRLRAPQATRRVFRLAAKSQRIERVYIYHWRAGGVSSWDSALVTEKGTLRPSFEVFAREARRGAER